MIKYPIPIIILVIIPFFIIPVNADSTVDFEDGTLYPFEWQEPTGTADPVVLFTELNRPRTGIYGSNTTYTFNQDGVNYRIGYGAYINLTNCDNISFYYWHAKYSPNTKFKFYYSNTSYTLPNVLNTWTYFEQDVSGISGTHYIQFVEHTEYTNPTYKNINARLYIDDIVFRGEGEFFEPPAEDPTIINFVPNVDETNNTDKPSFHFNVNNTHWSNYYELRIRQWRYTMVNDEWSEPPGIEWWVVSEYPFYATNYQTYLTAWPNTQDETEPFETWPYYFYPVPSGIYIMKFEVILYGADIYGSETILASDTMIYDSNYSYTSPPPEIPTSIPTAEPTPTPTYTPFPTTTPTPIPTPDPEDEGITNYTINKSGMGTFYDSVNGTIDNLNGSLNGVSDFFLIPTHGMTNYINSVNVSFTNNTNQSIGHKYILSEIMIPFIYHFPLKMQLLISYYLTLLLILIILER